MRLRAWVVLAVLAAGCHSQQDCPAGQVRDGGVCVAQSLCAQGTTSCGDICCAADQTCAAPGQCRGKPCSAQSDCASDEACTGGYCLKYDPSCTWTPPKDDAPFQPRVAWQWTGSQVQPAYRDVLMTPVVIPLHGSPPGSFEPPAIVFNSIRGDMGAGPEVPGVMRAIKGDGSGEIWTSDPAHLVNGLAGIAAGDLLGTGEMVMVTARNSNFTPSEEGLVAFGGNDGRFLWEVKGLHVQWGAPSIANLDGGKEASVVLGSAIVDAHGKLLCQGQYGTGSNWNGPISIVADVDLDGKPEIVTGNAVYDANCQPKPGWPARRPDGSLRADGLVAVADFTGDAHPEIVVVSGDGPRVNGVVQGSIRMHDWQGNLIWGPVPLPGGGAGGPPTIADFDGDGKPEIGVAAHSRYTVFKPFAANPVLWSATTQDNSDVTGSSVFDFRNTGRSQVVYGDECYTRIYDGPTGDVMFQAVNPSCTTHENPVIADVDRDGRAEIVVATNSVCGYICPWGTQYGSGYHGITVMKDLRDRWVGTRSIWNQHAYHVTNVLDDGRLPWPEQNNWQVPGLNDFRRNPLGSDHFAAPNLTATNADLSVDMSSCPMAVRATVKVWNRGAVPVAMGVPVAFYALPSHQLEGVATTRGSILPGQFEAVTITIQPAPTTPTGLEVHLNDDGTGNGVVNECNSADNVVRADAAYCPPRKG